MLHMLQVFHKHVESVCSTCFQLFQSYVAISVFHVVSYKCFIWMLHMFDTHVASVCSKYFICFKRMLHSSVSCCKCFVFQRYAQRVMGARPGRRGKRCYEPGVHGRGVLVLIPALGSHPRVVRGGGEGEGAVGVGWGETNGGQGTRAWRDEANRE